MQKIIFFDVDGTLLAHHKGERGIPIDAQKQMKRLQKQGYLLFVATGRPYAFISNIISDFGFDGYVLCNGAHVELHDKIIYHEPMDKEKTKVLIDALKNIDCEYIIETSRYGYLQPEYKILHDFFISCGINEALMCFDFEEEQVYPNALKLEINASGDIIKQIESLIEGNFGYDSHGTENSFEVYSKEITKAVGVQKTLEYLNIPVENSYAFGDGLNDLEMIQYVGHGVAMGNAVEELKAVANEVCGHVDENGLAKALEKIN